MFYLLNNILFLIFHYNIFLFELRPKRVNLTTNLEIKIKQKKYYRSKLLYLEDKRYNIFIFYGVFEKKLREKQILYREILYI